jgi:ADP-heptose:LPS heptosyltransferase
VQPGVLIVHPGALGDVLQAVPALRALRDADGGASRCFAGQPRLGRLLQALGVIEEARDFDGLGLEALFTRAPIPDGLARFAGRFGRVVSWFGSRDATYRARLGALAPGAIVAPPVPEDETAVWRHLVATLGSGASTCEPLRVTAAAKSRGALVVHPGSGADWKRWPPPRFAEVIRAARRHRPLPLIVHQGPADRAAVDALLADLDGAVERLVEPELPSLAAVLAGARAYLGGDSGVSHLAAAVGAPSVILFPPAHARRWAPWSPTATVIEMTGEADGARRATREIERLLGA